jgi:hypothetical protein
MVRLREGHVTFREETNSSEEVSPSFPSILALFSLIDFIPSFYDQLVHGCAAPWWSFHFFHLFNSACIAIPSYSRER